MQPATQLAASAETSPGSPSPAPFFLWQGLLLCRSLLAPLATTVLRPTGCRASIGLPVCSPGFVHPVRGAERRLLHDRHEGLCRLLLLPVPRAQRSIVWRPRLPQLLCSVVLAV